MLEKANNIKRSNTNSKNEIVLLPSSVCSEERPLSPGEEVAPRSQRCVAGGTGSRELCRAGGESPQLWVGFCPQPELQACPLGHRHLFCCDCEQRGWAGEAGAAAGMGT